MAKFNTFSDFVAAAELLLERGETSRDRLVIEGGSAGGLLIGAVVNMRPDLCKAAVLMVPFGALPWKVAVVAFALAVYATAVAALRLVGVRDWRCYGAALGSLPGFTAVTAGTLSWPLAFGAAAAWRYRERRWVVAASIVGVVVTKLFLWPLFIWLVATRRLRTAVTTAALGLVVVIGSWAVIGFDGLLDYPHRLGADVAHHQPVGPPCQVARHGRPHLPQPHEPDRAHQVSHRPTGAWPRG